MTGWTVFALTVVLWHLAESACTSCSSGNGRRHTYSSSMDHLENPHRGFVDQIVGTASHFDPLTVSHLDSERRRSGMTMVWRTYVLDTFRTKAMSADFLHKIRVDLTNVHTAGMTVVLRFCYTFHMNQHAPYGDATEHQILQHIQQLKPIFHDFEGVITSVEAGFIGTWGEWYYTTYFGDPEHRNFHIDPYYGYTPQQWQGRKNVLTALLDAVPQSIQVQLRYPGQKIAMFHTTKPITYADVNKNTKSYVARIASHNDCFLSSDNDVGTYKNASIERPYLAAETRYLIIGGETCRLTKNDRDHCPTALSEMKTFHWTWLNQQFDKDMYNLWAREGCYEEVHRKLGYRLRLTESILPDSVQKGGDFCVHLTLTNDGFAAPVKEMDVTLVMHDKASGKYYGTPITSVDVRVWQPNEHHTIATSVNIPTNIPAGQYDLYLAIGDKIMKHESDYYVLLANNGGVPVYSEGLNDLKHTLHVSSSHHSGSSSACAKVGSWTPPKKSKYNRLFTVHAYVSIIG
ncbi:uncharacterized protein [Haliotis cracherodii]|uniref:uncharacterized protein n=1 Tax=Haliotis cracherodii TaxID=6455 RepID=UPI0039E76828